MLSPRPTSESSKNPVNSFRQIAGLPRLGPMILRAIHDEPGPFDVLSVIKNGPLPRPELYAGQVSTLESGGKVKRFRREVRGGYRCKHSFVEIRGQSKSRLSGVRGGRYYLRGWGAEIHFRLFGRRCRTIALSLLRSHRTLHRGQKVIAFFLRDSLASLRLLRPRRQLTLLIIGRFPMTKGGHDCLYRVIAGTFRRLAVFIPGKDALGFHLAAKAPAG